MKTRNLTFWENGVLLSNSPRSFSPKSEREEYERLHSLSALEAINQALQEANDRGLTGLETYRASVSAALPITSARSDWNTRAQKFVLHHLMHENLYGFGFDGPRNVESEPFEIPKACWAGNVGWDKNELSSDGLKFSHIRVVSQAKRSRLIASELQTENIAKPGRPGYKEQILKAFKSLSEAGEIDPRQSLQSHYPKVRRWIELNIPKNDQYAKPPSDNTLQRHLSNSFNELKQNSKL